MEWRQQRSSVSTMQKINSLLQEGESHVVFSARPLDARCVTAAVRFTHSCNQKNLSQRRSLTKPSLLPFVYRPDRSEEVLVNATVEPTIVVTEYSINKWPSSLLIDSERTGLDTEAYGLSVWLCFVCYSLEFFRTSRVPTSINNGQK